MDPYDAIDAHLSNFIPSEDRALVRRWLVDFLAANPRLPVFAAAQAACQLLSRWGTDVLRESAGEEWTVRPLPASRREWESDGYRVPEDAHPLVLSHLDGSRMEAFLLFDVDLVDESLVGTIDHAAVREPAAPHELAPTLSEFAADLGERERAALSYLWRLGAVLERTGDAEAQSPGWIERSHRDSPCFPRPDLHGEDACYRFVLRRDVRGAAAMDVVLELVATLLGSWVQGRREGLARCNNPVEQLAGAEVAVVSRLVGARMGFGGRSAGGPPDVPEEINWGRVVETAQVMEDLLQGIPNPLFSVAGPCEQASPSARLLVEDPFREVGREISGIADLREREDAERWLLDFVAANGRFPLATALALGWQLRRRWGSEVVGDPARRDWIACIELRSVAEWRSRGWVPRPDAAELVVPSGHGREVHYLLAEDVLVADRLAALECMAEPEPENLALSRPAPADAPALAEFAELLPRREVEMLRNLWRNRLLPHFADGDGGPEPVEGTHLQLPVTGREDGSLMLSIMEMLAGGLLTHEMDAAPVCGWESALVAEITAGRMGVEHRPSPLVEEALGREDAINLRWEVIYQTAASVENVLAGFPQ